MSGHRRSRANVAVRALFALRFALGRLFRWDDPRHDPPDASYAHRLTDDDRVRSRIVPGTREGAFRTLYASDDEIIGELRNATVHGFLVLTLTRPHDRGGYTAYLAIYVKPVSRLTAFYMALIAPFRRFVVYPALVRQLQRAWLRAYVQPS